ncbi:hypothetical protein BsWGS_19062 [Bradybaena similaris]
MPASAESIVLRLYEVDAVKFGDFTLKSGIKSPVYFDLRVMISFPQLMTDVANLLWGKVSASKFKSLCGVPYTALPIATLMSASHNIPMLIRRKEAKGYGTKKLIEGIFNTGDVCLIVEDVVSSGSSVLETAAALKSAGLQVKDAVVLLDREQGGREQLEHEGIILHSVFTMSDILKILNDAGKLDLDTVDRVAKYIEHNRFRPDQKICSLNPKVYGYGERAKLCSNPLTRQIFEIMEEKRTNLALSADVTKSQELLQLVDKVGPYVCIVKTHVDILEDYTQETVTKLSQLASKHNFLIFEDRKFADIGNTVLHQFAGGIYNISSWAHIINAHGVPGPGVVHGLKEAGVPKGCGCLLIAEMSSAGNLATGDYTAGTVSMAEANKDFVIGFICVRNLTSDPTFVHMTPGVQLSAGQDSLGQQYLTPSEVITNRGSDIIIVGRGIYGATDAAEAAKQYQLAGYDAFVERLTGFITS